MKRKQTGGGRFDPAEDFIFFVAGMPVDFGPHQYTLMAVNDVKFDRNETPKEGGATRRDLDKRIESGSRVLLDSGIFNLTQQHASAHGVHMDTALALHPNEIEGFDWLLAHYKKVVKAYEADLWGYIELDQGGADRKRETRMMLESEGFRPIPVYHPLNDGWDYFDELCKGYDRVCVGNVVQANRATRARILNTIWERRRAYPSVWIHVLGLTPNEMLNAAPAASSADSSSLGYMYRYGAPSVGAVATAQLHSFSRYTHGFSYPQGDVPLMDKASRFASLSGYFLQHAWRRQADDLRAEFGDDALAPKRAKREPMIERAT